MLFSFQSQFTATKGIIWIICGEDFKMDLNPYFSDPDGDDVVISVARENGDSIPVWMGI